MKKVDLPPVWLALFVALAWGQASYFDSGLRFGGAWVDFVAALLVAGWLVLTVLAVVEFRRHRTTVNPHGQASALVQSGIFSRSRNPIYLADVLLLSGLILRFDAVLSVPLIPIFVWLIKRRFILIEEDRLRQAFGAEFASYEGKVRRWV